MRWSPQPPIWCLKRLRPARQKAQPSPHLFKPRARATWPPVVFSEGNFYISVLFRPARPRGDWPSLSLVSGLALYSAVAEWRDPSDLGLKWPNDLLYQGGKTAGILLEAQDDVVVLGCGVNLNAPPDQVEGWAPSALNQSQNQDPVTKEGLLACFNEHLTRYYNLWSETGFAGVKTRMAGSICPSSGSFDD